MNVSGVAGSHTAVPNSNGNKVIEALQKQKADLSKQIQEVRSSDQDPKAKNEKIKQLNEQMAEIDKQIMAARAEEKRQEAEEAQAKREAQEMEKKYAESDPATQDGVVLSQSLHQLIDVHNGVKDLRSLHKTQVELEGQKRVAEIEYKNSSMTSNGGSGYQLKAMEKIAAVGVDNDSLIRQKSKEVSKKLDKAVKTGEEETKQAQQHKDDPKHSDSVTGKQPVAPDEAVAAPAVPQEQDDMKAADNEGKKEKQRGRKF